MPESSPASAKIHRRAHLELAEEVPDWSHAAVGDAGPAFCAKAALTSLGPSSRCGRSTEKTDSFSSAMDSLSAAIRSTPRTASA